MATPGSNLIWQFLQLDALPNTNHSECLVGAYYVPPARGPVQRYWQRPRSNGVFYVPPAQASVQCFVHMPPAQVPVRRSWKRWRSNGAFYVPPAQKRDRCSGSDPTRMILCELHNVYIHITLLESNENDAHILGKFYFVQKVSRIWCRCRIKSTCALKCETWAVTAEDMRKLARNEASMLRWMSIVSVHTRQSTNGWKYTESIQSVFYPDCGMHAFQGGYLLFSSRDQKGRLQSDLAVFLQLDAFPNANHSENVVGAFYVSPAQEPVRRHWHRPRLDSAFYVPPAQELVWRYWHWPRSVGTFYMPLAQEPVKWTWHRPHLDGAFYVQGELATATILVLLDSTGLVKHIISHNASGPEGLFVEWKAEEVPSSDEHDWAVVGNAVGYKLDRQSESVTINSKTETRKKYNISFDILDLKSLKTNSVHHGWKYFIFILKDGTTYPALHFHSGGSSEFFSLLSQHVCIQMSPNDNRLWIVEDHDPGFSKVTSFFRDALLQPSHMNSRPLDEIAVMFNEDLPGMEINQQDEPGFEVITKKPDKVHSVRFRQNNQTKFKRTKLPPPPETSRGEPLQAHQWTSFLDAEGKVTNIDEVKKIIFRGGIEPTMRVEVWKFLLDYYKWDSTKKSREEERKRKVDDYFKMKLQWKTISAEQESRFTKLKDSKTLIEKDVSRTDRTHKFFEGDGNHNLQVLNDILRTYCMYNFDLSYVQGMSDLLSPILVIMENEVDAFWCFAGFMETVCSNFEMDQQGMKTQLAQMHTLMQFVDPELCSYLESHDSGNFYFCFRWLLIVFKREFSFPDIQRLWEVLWTGLPCKNYHLLICLAILDNEKATLMENRFGFTEILKHINDMSFTINVDQILNKAESISLQLKKCKKLPQAIKEILELGASSSSPSASSNSSGSTTPAAGNSQCQYPNPNKDYCSGTVTDHFTNG
uniref:TBC1 domain family member 15 n=1 Tax=Octopus bimaculoides TaxID=37653 RepID=A0A0L8GZX2_OCTBM